jgi:hypothetical protein
MLDKIKLLLNLSDREDKDDLISLLISLCKNEAVDYCNLEEYDEKLDSAVIAMVIERYNKLGSEGISSEKFSGIDSNFSVDYTEPILKKLRKNRRIKCV